MKIRADIAALVRAGHSDASIARRLQCGRGTANEVRRALQLPPSGALQRLYAEEAPTGKVHDYRPDRMPTSPQQQAANRAALLAALRGEAA
ncbi:helix-turn-helix domain-containing protein [Streptomyces sp. NPDC048604]|uniref:helix-turn-helix domain-containing protein n=1 Tax=Streptomyces sp. NPDC048604 TaxID=3365578 RepID=UPI00371233F1